MQRNECGIDRVPELRLVLRHGDSNRIGQRHRRRLRKLIRICFYGLVDRVDVVDVGVGTARKDRLDAIGVISVKLDLRRRLSVFLACPREVLK